MGAVAVPASAAEAMQMSQTSAGYLADLDAASMPAEVLGQYIRDLVQADAVITAALARMLAAYDAKDGHLADGQRSLGAWLVHMARVTRGQAAEFKAMRALPRDHGPLLAGLRAKAVTKSMALQLAKWTREIPAEFRGAGRGHPGRRRAGRGGPAGAGADLRGDPVPDRPAGPGRPGPGAGPGPVPGHHPGRRRGPARGPHPRMRRDGPGRPGRPVRPGRGRGPADPAAALPRRARRGDEAPPGVQPAARSGPGSPSRPWST